MSNVDKSKEAEEVFEFLDSLPQGAEGKGKSGGDAAEGAAKGQAKAGGKDDDIMDFLDELEKEGGSKSAKKEAGVSSKPVEEPVIVPETAKPAVEQPVEASAKEAVQEPETEKKQVEESTEDSGALGKEETPLGDPITSISNWWSSSGSNTVSSLWSKTTEQANQIKNRIAQEQQQLPQLGQLPQLPLSINSATISDLAKSLQKIVVGETAEVMRIHLVHDLVNYSYLQYHVEQRFDQVLSDQVQGGVRIFVDEWGKPGAASSETDTVVLNADDIGNNGNISVVKNPSRPQRHLNVFTGKLSDGEKLAFANLDNAIKLFNKAHDEVLRQQKESANSGTATGDSDEDQTNISDIFISILPVAIPASKTSDNTDGDMTVTDAAQQGNFSFTIVLKDITNGISSITRSQGFPSKWIDWLEGAPAQSKTEKVEEKDEAKKEDGDDEDDEEEEVDPSEWVQDWIEDGISLVFGIVAQNYVIERMGFS